MQRRTYRDVPEKFEAGTPDIAGVIGLLKIGIAN
jgi:selenocysteine lyase/cysteine desulfurase